jgi:hypothetical protein
MNGRFDEPLPRLTREALEELFLYVLRDREVYEEAAQTIQPEYFDAQDEAPLQLLWATIVEMSAEATETVQYRELRLELYSRIEEDAGTTLTKGDARYLVGEGDENTAGVLEYVFNHVNAADMHTDEGMNLLRRFLEERAVVDQLMQLAQSRNRGGMPVGYENVLGAIDTTRERISQIGTSSACEAIPLDWAPEPVRGIDSLIEALDAFMPHGQPYGGVMGMLAPMGVGKTTFAVAAAVSTAKHLRYRHEVHGEPLRAVVLVTYEEPIKRLRNRVIACAAQVSKTTLDRSGSLDDFAVAGRPGAYERRITIAPEFKDASGQPVGELERLAIARDQVNKNLFLLDMSGLGGGGQLVTKGSGYVPELVAELKALERSTGLSIGWVAVDYMGKMIDRHFRHSNADYGQLRHWIRGCPDEIRMKIAEYFDCTVWLLHQLAGEATKRHPTAKMHHADAAEGRMFAENLHYCFVIGNKDENTRVSLLHCTKDRDTGNENTRSLIEMDGEMQRVESRDEQYAVDVDNAQIRAIGDLNRMGGEAAIGHAAQAPGRQPGQRGPQIRNGASREVFGLAGDGDADS